MRIVSIMVVALLLSSCAHRINWNDPRDIANHVQVKNDDFQKVTSFNGPNCAQDQLNDMLLLRAWRLRDGTLEYQIYVADEYTYEVVRGPSGWRHYARAHDADGNELQAKVLSKNVEWCGRNVCSYVEILGMKVDREYLEERKDRGLRFKISGRNGEEVFAIPPTYIEAFLSIVK